VTAAMGGSVTATVRAAYALPSDVALHESGHVVGDIAAGVSIRSVEIDRRSGAGLVRVGVSRHVPDLWALLVAHLSGLVAESFFTGGNLQSRECADLAHAREVAVRLLGMTDRRSIDVLVSEANVAAWRFVCENQAAIAPLAYELDERGRLTGAECKAIVGTVTAIPARRAW